MRRPSGDQRGLSFSPRTYASSLAGAAPETGASHSLLRAAQTAKRPSGEICTSSSPSPLASIHIHRPHLLMRLGHAAGGIGHLAFAIGFAAADIHNCAAVRRQARAADGLAVVAALIRALAGAELGRIRSPYVAHAPRREHPCDSAAVLGNYE